MVNTYQINDNQINIGQNDNSNLQPNSQTIGSNNNQQVNQEEEEKIEFASQIQSFNNSDNQNQNIMPTVSQMIK